MSLSVSSLFVQSPCRFDGDTIVSKVAWSEADGIAAMISSTIDENDRELHQVLFINSEGSLLSNSVISHDCEATVLAWQPKHRMLAIGKCCMCICVSVCVCEYVCDCVGCYDYTYIYNFISISYIYYYHHYYYYRLVRWNGFLLEYRW